MGLYRAFNRILRKGQEACIIVTDVEESPFSMRGCAMFKPVGTACILAMKRIRNLGINIARKKASVISVADEEVILADPCTAAEHSRSLQRRVVFFLLCRFAIKGGEELYKLTLEDFKFGDDSLGRFVSYDERLSKNYKVSLDRYQEEHFRPAVFESDDDVVMSTHTLICHLPELYTCLFHQPIDSPRTKFWYNSSRISIRKLSSVLKEIHVMAGLATEGVSNKSGRTTLVTRMGAEGVPPAIGMRITRHKSHGAYARYDRSTEAQVRATQRTVADGSKFDSNLLQEIQRTKNTVVAGKRSAEVIAEVTAKRAEVAAGKCKVAEGTDGQTPIKKVRFHDPVDAEDGAADSSYKGSLSGESGDTEVTMDIDTSTEVSETEISASPIGKSQCH